MYPQSVYFCNVFRWMPKASEVCIALYRPVGDTLGSSAVIISFFISLCTKLRVCTLFKTMQRYKEILDYH